MNQTLVGFIRKELTQTLRDPRMRVVLFLVPMFQLIVFGFAVSNEVKNVRLAAVFDSKDTLMQHIYERSLASQMFLTAQTHERDPFEMIQADEADAVIVAPPGGLTKAMGRQSASLQLLIDASNVLEAQAIEAYIKQITLKTLQNDLQLNLNKIPIQIDSRILFNPEMNTAIFMVPGTLCMLMLLTTMIMTNTAIVREKEMGTFEMLISAPVSASEVIYGKTIPYVILGMANFPFILSVAIFLFRVPMRGSFLLLFLSAFAFTCTAVAMGTLISTFCKNQQQASLASFLVIFPMMMFSGLMFPVENMPFYLRWLSQLDPLTHFMGLLRNIMLKGGGPSYALIHISVLALMAIVSTIISFKRFRTTLT
ncbi:MAG: ABC transporter permease [Bdellovibrionales bacterium]|nr:ABC transporter permease [Bdellovibrionales bacterium]